MHYLYPVLGPANASGNGLLPNGSWNGTTMSYGTLPASDGTIFSTRFTAYDGYGNPVPDWSTGTVSCSATGGGSCPPLTQPGQPTSSQGQSTWVNEGSFPSGSYTLTFTPSGPDVTTYGTPYKTSITFTVNNNDWFNNVETSWPLTQPIPQSSPVLPQNSLDLDPTAYLSPGTDNVPNGIWFVSAPLTATEAGSYTFTFQADDAAVLYLDGKILGTSVWGDGTKTVTVALPLVKGTQVVDFEVTNNDENSTAIVPYDSGTPNPSGLYFQLTGPSGQTVLSSSQSNTWHLDAYPNPAPPGAATSGNLP